MQVGGNGKARAFFRANGGDVSDKGNGNFNLNFVFVHFIWMYNVTTTWTLRDEESGVKFMISNVIVFASFYTQVGHSEYNQEYFCSSAYLKISTFF